MVGKKKLMIDMQKREEFDIEIDKTVGKPFVEGAKFSARNVDVFYGDKQAIFDANIDIGKNQIIAMIGPSGCGKSTLLRCLNRMNDTIQDCRIDGDIKLDGEDIYHKHQDPVLLRARVGMVFQKPNPFPKSIYENVAYGPKIHGLSSNKNQLDEIVEKALTRAGLWAEVKDRLHDSGTGLSGGQQQRVALARVLVSERPIVLMDEPLSNLDAKLRVEIRSEIRSLNKELGITVVYVTHDQSEALTMSDRVAVFEDGRIQQLSSPDALYERPENSFVAQFIGENNKLVGQVDTIKGKVASVKLDNGKKVESLAVNCGKVGSRTTLSIRPERVRLGGAKTKNTTDAVVKELIYLGDHIRCRMEVHGNEEFIVKVPNSAGHKHLVEGEKTSVTWAKEDCRALDA